MRASMLRLDHIARRAPPRVLAGIGLLAVAGAIAGYQLIPEPQAHAAAPSQLQVASLPAPDAAGEKALALKAARAYLHEPLHIHVGPDVHLVSRAALGAEVDLRHLEELILRAREPSSTLRRLHAQLHRTGPLELPVPAHLEGTQARDWVLRLKDQVDQRRRDARVELPSGTIVPEQDGASLDVHATLDAIAHALLSGERQVHARVVQSPARRTQEQLDDLDLTGVLAEFETRYSTLEKDEARAYNLHVAGEHLDGLVLMPGEELDFNDVVGERSEANGFRIATVIASGELAQGVGGGTCQIASTLHAAAYFAGLTILKRHPHSRPSGYIKLGLDAVVSYPKLNLRLNNPFAHPIAIGVDVGGGRVRVQVRGPGSVERMVSFVRRVDEVLPYEEREREDSTLPEGVRVLAQRGVPGFELTTFRVVRDQRTHRAVRQRRQDIYPPTTQVWRVGTGAPATEDYTPPEGDKHREYRADEYLVMTFDPADDAIHESRRAGKTGVPGWTAEMGMPQVDADEDPVP